jgi:hypothetical protein
MGKPFDLEAFRIQTEMQKELRPKAAKRIKRTNAFAIVPLWWAARAVEDAGVPVNFMVCVDLVYRAWKTKGKSFVMPNLQGVDHKTKARTLRGLERAGLISVEWRRRKSPVVTLIASIF